MLRVVISIEKKKGIFHATERERESENSRYLRIFSLRSIHLELFTLFIVL